MLILKKLKLLVIFGIIMTTIVYMLWPEVVDVTMKDNSITNDVRIEMFDPGDKVYVPNSSLGENMEVLHIASLVIIFFIMTIQSITFIRHLIFSREWDLYEINPMIVSFPFWILIAIVPLYFISFLSISHPVTFISIYIIYGIAYLVGSIIAGISFSEDENGIFNVFNSSKKYFKHQYEYDEKINELTETYKTQIS